MHCDHPLACCARSTASMAMKFSSRLPPLLLLREQKMGGALGEGSECGNRCTIGLILFSVSWNCS